MRILFVHNRFGASSRGGAERVLAFLAEGLAARGHGVHIAAPQRTGNMERGTKNQSDTQISGPMSHVPCPMWALHVPNIAPFDRLGSLPPLVRAVWHAVDLLHICGARSFRALLTDIKPDIVHTHNLVGCGGLLPRVIRRARIPWAHTLHDVQLITPSGLILGNAPQSAMERSSLGALFRVARRRLMGSPSVVISPTRWLLDLHRRYGFFPSSRTAIVGNPVAIAEPIPRNGAVRTLLFIGQLEGTKGIHILVEAYRRLRAVAPDASLQIIGDGSAMGELRRMARDLRGIVLRGRLPPDGVRAALAAADLLIVPSLAAENQPSVILEAFAAGVPVIASRVGGIPELIDDGVTGFLVDPGSAEDLFRVLWCCLEEPSRVREIATNCQRAVTPHAVDRVAERTEALYTAAASEHTP